MNEIIEKIKVKLIDGGFSGLSCDGECGCLIEDLAPCGELCQEEGEDYINGCDGGHVFYDPDRLELWVVKKTNVPPTDAEWEKHRKEFFS
jgi:hypothetical protein